jgi:hypothetical protein
MTVETTIPPAHDTAAGDCLMPIDRPRLPPDVIWVLVAASAYSTYRPIEGGIERHAAYRRLLDALSDLR